MSATTETQTGSNTNAVNATVTETQESMIKMDALRLVVQMHDDQELIKTRAENVRLKEELSRWKGATRLPQVGCYYTMNDGLPHLLEPVDDPRYVPDIHSLRGALLRYDGAEEHDITHKAPGRFTYVDDDTCTRVYLHRFTSSFAKYGMFNQTPMFGGWDTLHVETTMLHFFTEVDWNDEEVRSQEYIDSNDVLQNYRRNRAV